MNSYRSQLYVGRWLGRGNEFFNSKNLSHRLAAEKKRIGPGGNEVLQAGKIRFAPQLDSSKVLTPASGHARPLSKTAKREKSIPRRATIRKPGVHNNAGTPNSPQKYRNGLNFSIFIICKTSRRLYKKSTKQEKKRIEEVKTYLQAADISTKSLEYNLYVCVYIVTL